MVSRLGGTATGALAGAGTGATIGSVIPGVGTAIGAGVGGLVGGITGFLNRGHEDQFKQVPRFSKQQQQLQNQFIQQMQGGGLGQNYNAANQYLQGILSGSPDAYQRFAAPYQQQFEQKFLPNLLERFASMGGGLGGGIGNSSGFGQGVGGAGAQFNADLARMYENMRMQAAQQAYGQYNQAGQFAFNPSFENVYQPGTQGFGGAALPGMMQGVGQGFGQMGGYNMMQNWGGGGGQPGGVGNAMTGYGMI